MATRSVEPSVRRSFDASPAGRCAPPAGGSSPHSASTIWSVGTTSPGLQGEHGEKRTQLRARDHDVVAVVVEHLEPTEQPDADAGHRTPGLGGSAEGQRRVSPEAQGVTMTNLAPPSSTRRERQVVQITALMRAANPREPPD